MTRALRTLKEAMDALPPKRRKAVGARTKQIRAEIKSLEAWGKDARIAPNAVAKALGISQAVLLKRERQIDKHLAALRGYLEELGGGIEMVVRLPQRDALSLELLSDLRDRTHKP